jgi:alanyl-tRNA synthetase
MGPFSMELCGGTHATATGDIGMLKVVSESSIAAGLRRIEAVTGLGALELVQRQSGALGEIAKLFKAKPGQEAVKVAEAALRIKALEKEVAELRQAQARLQASSLLTEHAKDINGFKVLLKSLDEKAVSREALSALVDGLAGYLKTGVAVLTHASGDALSIVAISGSDVQSKIKAGDLIKAIGPVADARGGGKADRAQAGSKSPEKAGLVLLEAEKHIKQALGA